MAEAQSKKWQLTINHPEDNGIWIDDIVVTLKKKNPQYFCLAEEIGEQRTRHVHVFTVFSSAVRFGTIKKLFPAAHIEQALGSISENVDYIRKEGKHADKAVTSIPGTFKEFGERPLDKVSAKDAIPDIMQMFRDGFTVDDVIRKYPVYGMRLTQLDALQDRIVAEEGRKGFRDVDVIYIYGKTGTGKTSYVFSQHESSDICRVTNYGTSGVFDSYHGQTVIVFEEFDSQIPIQQMLTYLDRYPVELPARYYSRTACYKTVYILSNLPLESQYADVQRSKPEVWKAFLRRIKMVKHHIGFDEQIIEGKDGFRKCDTDYSPFS